VTFLWHHRLQDLQMDGEGVTATVEKLAFSGGGYSVPDFQLSVAKEFQIRADYLIGADGHASIVSQRLEIKPQRVGKPELFVVYEFETDTALEHDLIIILDEATVNVMWPLGGKRCRWAFQWLPADSPRDFPEKDRTRFVVQDGPGPDSTEARLEKLLHQRAPWFKARMTEIVWSADVQFEHWSAAQFQRERCFLAGDAAHQTGPVGMQSMNCGLSEGADLARKLNQVLDGGSAEARLAYDHEHRVRWEKLLSAAGNSKATSRATFWTKQNCARIIDTLPLSGKDLSRVLEGIGIEFKQA
jgi:3-(3-hydroxy-phenyl)propionate hydroxylase